MQAAQVITAVPYNPGTGPSDGTAPALGGAAFFATMRREDGPAHLPEPADLTPGGPLKGIEADLSDRSVLEATAQPVPTASGLPSAVAVAIVVQSAKTGDTQLVLPGSPAGSAGGALAALTGSELTASGDIPAKGVASSPETPALVAMASGQPTGEGTTPRATDGTAARQPQTEAPVAPAAPASAATPPATPDEAAPDANTGTGTATDAAAIRLPGPAPAPGAAPLAGLTPAPVPAGGASVPPQLRLSDARRDDGGRVPSSWSLLTQNFAIGTDAPQPEPLVPMVAPSLETAMDGLPSGDRPAEPDTPQSIAVATSAPAPAPQVSVPAPVAALPASVPQDLVAVLRQQPDGPVEISLSPEELGQLRVSLWADGDGIRMVVQAERGETLDLLRRNAEILMAELRAEGFADGRLDFSSWGGDSRAPTQARDDVEDRPSIAAASFPQTLAQHANSGSGLDLRL